MAFVNAAGYDREMAPEMHPVRARVRSLMTERLDALPEVRQRLRVFYEELVLPNWVYLDYSLSLSPGLSLPSRPPGRTSSATPTPAIVSTSCRRYSTSFGTRRGLPKSGRRSKPTTPPS